MTRYPLFLASVLLLSCCSSDSGNTEGTADARPSTGADAAFPATQSDASPPADFGSYLKLINQEVFREDDAFAAGGTGRFHFFSAEPLPADDRISFTNGDGEKCTYESETEWPTTPSSSADWPTGSPASAGDLHIDVTDGPNQIIFDEFEGGYFREEPTALQQGDFTHNSFFDSSNLPSGKNFIVSAQGGTNIGSFSFSSKLPADYTVSSPDMMAGNDTIDVAEAFTFAWSPASSGARMEVILKDSFSFVRCNFDDDGSGEVPAEAMNLLSAGLFSKLVVHMIRQETHDAQVADSNGKQVQIDFVAEHVKIGRFDSEDSSQ